MKKIVILLLIAILLGVGLGIYSYQKFNEDDDLPVSNTSSEVYAFQVGVFDKIDNAKMMAKNFNGIIVNDGKYRVYVAFTINNLNNLKSYLDQRGVAYYIKSIYVNSEFYKVLQDYDSLLANATIDSYENIISEVLKEYDNYENNN